jgi:hypothetical protein
MNRRITRLEGSLRASIAPRNIPIVIDRGASEEDRAEGDARVAELYASGQLDPNDRYINVIRVQFVEPPHHKPEVLAALPEVPAGERGAFIDFSFVREPS